MTALTKVETPLMERYETTCVSCGWYRHFFGTAQEARDSALKMGWEFRNYTRVTGRGPDTMIETAWCPHCSILVKS